jgi:hypothetical protein
MGAHFVYEDNGLVGKSVFVVSVGDLDDFKGSDSENTVEVWPCDGLCAIEGEGVLAV